MTPFCFINCTNIWPNSLTPHVCLSFVAEVVDRVQWNSYPCKTSTMILSNEYLSTKNDSKIILAWSGVELLILIIKIFKNRCCYQFTPGFSIQFQCLWYMWLPSSLLIARHLFSSTGAQRSNICLEDSR